MKVKIMNSYQVNETSIMLPYNIIIDCCFSPEEQEASRVVHERCGDDWKSWENYIRGVRGKIAQRVDVLLEKIEEEFSIGQLHDDGGKYPYYDLWFWCNNDDHSYIHLCFLNHYRGYDTEKLKKDAERINAIYNRVLEIVKAFEDKNLNAVCNFISEDLPNEISRIAMEKAMKMDGKQIDFDGMIGKFWIDNDNQRYCFKKRYARKKYYVLGSKSVLRCQVLYRS